MAIKLDGHTITELKLKASDGSEVTKQLTEEGTIPTPTEALSITANGTYDVTTKASAVVNVPAPEINLQNKTATANGEVTADEGYDGLGVVTVAVSGDTPTYQEKTATQNGVVLPDEGYDALSKVTVNVPAPVLPTLTNPASASDILSGKEALDGDGAKLTGTCTFDADTSDADATASDIAQGKTAYVNGVKVVGTASGGGARKTSGSFICNGITGSEYELVHNAGYNKYYAHIEVDAEDEATIKAIADANREMLAADVIFSDIIAVYADVWRNSSAALVTPSKDVTANSIKIDITSGRWIDGVKYNYTIWELV